MVDRYFFNETGGGRTMEKKKDKRYVSGVQEKESVSMKDMKKNKEKV
jgi:hypothetical protein